MIITDIDGGANNGGETIITNGDGTNADAGGLPVADQEDWALDGAKACANARNTYIRQTGNGNINYAIGFLLQPKYAKSPEPYGPILGKGPDQSGHSEQKIVDYWSTTRIPQLRDSTLRSSDHLMLLIFSRNNVCFECHSVIPMWRTVLAIVAGLGVTIHFYLWESIDPYSPVCTGNLQLVPVSF